MIHAKLKIDDCSINKIDALAMLYLQKQELQNISVGELVDLYLDTVGKINVKLDSLQKEPTKDAINKWFGFTD